MGNLNTTNITDFPTTPSISHPKQCNMLAAEGNKSSRKKSYKRRSRTSIVQGHIQNLPLAKRECSTDNKTTHQARKNLTRKCLICWEEFNMQEIFINDNETTQLINQAKKYLTTKCLICWLEFNSPLHPVLVQTQRPKNHREPTPSTPLRKTTVSSWLVILTFYTMKILKVLKKV